jgi:hypothetical protein
MWAIPVPVVCLVVAAATLIYGATAPVRHAETTSHDSQPAKKWLRVEVQQDGRTIPIKNYAVTIQRKPFDLVFHMPDKSTVLVRTASHSALFDLAKSGKPLGKVFRPGQTGAASAFNKDEDLFMDDPTLQGAWGYDSTDKDHAFNEVVPAPGGVFKSRRRIANVFVNGNTTPIGKTDFAAMYLVFLTGQSAPDFNSTIEEQRDYLKIAFTAPVASAAPPAADPARGKPFAIALEQLGSAVKVTAGEARVRKAPFDVLVDLKGIPGVYVHAAFDAGFYEKARRGEPLGAVFRRAQTMALGRFNDGQLLFINGEDSHHFWYADSRAEHDFSALTPVAGGVQGRRVISQLWVGNAPVLVHRVPQSILYLVFYSGDLSTEGDNEQTQRAHERQRETLKITMQ